MALQDVGLHTLTHKITNRIINGCIRVLVDFMYTVYIYTSSSIIIFGFLPRRGASKLISTY